MTQGPRGGASKPCELGLILIVTGLADAFTEDVQTLKAMLLAERSRADRLSQIIEELQRYRFGRRAETLPMEQLELGLEDSQQAEAAGRCGSRGQGPAARAAKAGQRRTNPGRAAGAPSSLQGGGRAAEPGLDAIEKAQKRYGKRSVHARLRTRGCARTGSGLRQERIDPRREIAAEALTRRRTMEQKSAEAKRVSGVPKTTWLKLAKEHEFGLERVKTPMRGKYGQGQLLQEMDRNVTHGLQRQVAMAMARELGRDKGKNMGIVLVKKAVGLAPRG